MNKYFTQNLNHFLGDTDHVLPHLIYDKICVDLAQHHADIVNDYKHNKHSPVFNLCYQDDDIKEFLHIANYFRQYFDDIIILGTGGSSLGARALQDIALSKNNTVQTPNLHIITNTDPVSYHELWDKLHLRSTGVIVISKSGETIETLMQLMVMLPHLKKTLSPSQLKDSICVVTQEGDNALRALANHYGWRVLNHDANLSGRYSVLSVVGLLPAFIMGLDIYNIRKGAQDVLENYAHSDYRDIESIKSAACLYGLSEHNNMSCVVMLAYANKLGSLSRWFRQLWAESIGKNNIGTTPIYAMGPVDQHSQLQLWLDGPKDKIFTLLSVDFDEVPYSISSDDTMLHPNLQQLAGKNIPALMRACSDATYEVIHEHKLPIRTIHIPTLNEATIGALMMHFMLETIHTARLYNINPFNQPAVEQGKQLIWRNVANSQ